MIDVLVIGNGMVGYKFCEKLVNKAPEGFKITVFGEEPSPAYDRVHLSEYFAHKSVEPLLMAPRQWYEENAIELITSEMVVSINREAKSITTHKGRTFNYDKLVLATGSTPFVPPIEGSNKSGVFVYRTVEDLDAMEAYSKNAKTSAVLGGGLLGLEAAKAAMDMGLEAHVIEFAPRLMPRQLDEAGSDMLQATLESMGLHIHLSKSTASIDGDEAMTSMTFTDGSTLEAEMLIISCGIRPRDELANESGLEKGERGGIKIDELTLTSDCDIYAIGEVASYKGLTYGLVAPGYDMATVAVEHLTGADTKGFTGADMSTKLKLIGVDVASFGDALDEGKQYKSIVFEDKNAGIYKRVNISKDGKKLMGGILVGDASNYNMLFQMMLNGMALPPHPEDLVIDTSRQGAPAGNTVDTLPDGAQICSCENVTKGALVQAIEGDGVEQFAALKTCTKAGTGCGACSPMVNDILTATLKKMGKKVRKVLCEHFAYTRQELFDLVKLNNIHSFDQLINDYGKGHGCETCKPAVASILASAWNGLILKQDTIQDTNDRFLANIQKGGTYSVIPRIAGGEITPEKLIVIGEVAKKYDLYAKITGGQRIDLLGARIDQLPEIWEELINAGFESGHAYGKALRTVKSCVGSSWCRYGLHDSVSFAIRIEERYKGLRAPHKIKSAVSGCRRECAEALSKDFGIIATEKGWNLYVGGNGGANPQHAVLLAGDIDEETCIAYIDRFLMFYIKTAEPLNRTATWMNKLEGGLDYLKQVVVEDSLGMGKQLEAEMQLLVEAYACEWKEVVNNPALRARFKHFVNSPEADPSLKFDKQRAQKVPAGW
ncbi:nitrite reductase large subunit NirB [uncultured Imperialibacter sp.]|uniref:nitrite reductase large subunit NirB n=1 Tax=uncultured Imperialibacter sp. TaxID=1672639 RepID=UPI0030DCEFA5|tara:strand:- start:15388 stop:17877 length:2490 start_codon:yes stop_codon:yes gene_type:complete